MENITYKTDKSLESPYTVFYEFFLQIIFLNLVSVLFRNYNQTINFDICLHKMQLVHNLQIEYTEQI